MHVQSFILWVICIASDWWSLSRSNAASSYGTAGILCTVQYILWILTGMPADDVPSELESLYFMQGLRPSNSSALADDQQGLMILTYSAVYHRS